MHVHHLDVVAAARACKRGGSEQLLDTLEELDRIDEQKACEPPHATEHSTRMANGFATEGPELCQSIWRAHGALLPATSQLGNGVLVCTAITRERKHFRARSIVCMDFIEHERLAMVRKLRCQISDLHSSISPRGERLMSWVWRRLGWQPSSLQLLLYADACAVE
jgi:hypothetical protein